MMMNSRILLVAVFTMFVTLLLFPLISELESAGGLIEDISIALESSSSSDGDSPPEEVTNFDPAPRTSNIPYNTISPSSRYFIYSASGGLSNQLIELSIAMEICAMLNRTLIAPMIARHSSGYRIHESLPPSDLFPMDRIIDVEWLSQKAPVVPLNVSVVDFISKTPKDWVHTIFHPYRLEWVEKDIFPNMAHVTKPILYLKGAEMYHHWFAPSKQAALRLLIRFSPTLRQRAVDIVQATFPGNKQFNAMHIRLGDYTRRWPESFSARARMIADKAFKPMVKSPQLALYLASDEPLNDVFGELKSRVKVFTTKDLSSKLVEDYRELFPPSRIRLDMLGVLDQLICSQSETFISTEFSTFSESIRIIRSHKQVLFPEIYRSKEDNDNEVEEEEDQEEDF